MNIALPILLLIFGGLSFWVLSESKLRWYFKTICISTFCLFTVIFWMTIHTFLGWAAEEADVPEKMLIHWVIIKEPNKLTEYEGAIYVLSESVEQPKGNKFIQFFQYRKDRIEPRLYEIRYSRSLHEQLQKEVMSKLKTGQPVLGRLRKVDKTGMGKNKGEGEAKKSGEGSESQEQDWEFHELLPSEIHRKPDR